MTTLSRRIANIALIIVNLTMPAHALTLLVDKSDKTLFVMEGERIVKAYRVAIGKKPEGHKQHQGDNRTPEGHYWATRRECSGCIFKRAYAINYPNRKDRKEKRTGGAILIHGGRNPFYLWTAGCIAVSNADFDELWASLPGAVQLEVRP